MARKNITYDEIRGLSPTELGKMSKSQLADLLRKIRVKTQTRMEQLEKVSKTVFSPAAYNLNLNFISQNGKYPVTSKMSRNQVLSEIFIHQNFHKAQSSTVQGARKIQREQDIRLFGETPSGRPKKRMSVEQRFRFWAVYEEFNRTYKNKEYLYGSNRIQQALASMVAGNKLKSTNTINTEDLDELLRTLEESQQEEREEQGDYEFDDANVYSGRWTG